MPLRTECPRCPTPLPGDGGACPEHGQTDLLLRADEASYDGFVEALSAARGLPTYLPWPMSPGWSVTDFAVVSRSARGADARATMTCTSGTSALDGPVDVFVVTEESGTGLGARCAGTSHLDPGPEIGLGPPMVRVRIGSQSVPLWPVSTVSAGAPGGHLADDQDVDRSVVAGEALGRWLWIVMRPASAILLLRDEWILRDVSAIGPPLVEMPFGGPPPIW
jgi:hypothetical protein